MVKDTQGFQSHGVDSSVHTKRPRRGVSKIRYWRAWVNSSGSVTLDDDTGASQAEPDPGNKVERYDSRHGKVHTPIGVL